MILVQDKNGVPDTGDCHRNYVFEPVLGIHLLQERSCLTEPVIVEIRLLLSLSPYIRGDAGVIVLHLRGKNGVSALVYQKSPHALCAKIKSKYKWIVHDTKSYHKCDSMDALS